MSTSLLTESSWKPVGELAPGALIDARLQLHHAAQIAVSAAISYIPARSDDSHTALTWLPTYRALVTEPIPSARPLRIGLRLEDLTLQALDDGPGWAPTFALAGRTAVDAHAWLGEVAAEAGLENSRLTQRKHYTIPSHPVASGEAFSTGISRELLELARYWSNAAALLDEIAHQTEGSSPVRTWPHHFDIATLIELPGAPRATIGIGHSPGDDSYAEPYWYVGPYPYPSTEALPPVAGGGHWHTSGWVGAVLPASGYVAAGDQRTQVAAFVDSAVAACRSLLAR